MFGFFKKNKPTINALSFPTFGWDLVKDTPALKQWINPEQTQSLSINFFALPPDLPTIQKEDVLCDFFRQQIVAANGGIIQVDIAQKANCPYVKTIFKIPQQPKGITYVGSLIFPFKQYSYVVKIQAIEVGTTGMRDSVIAGNLMAAGVIKVGDNGFEGWFQDPYKPDFEGGTLMNLSEAEAYDAQFEGHPLSQVRGVLRAVEEQLEVGEVLLKQPSFSRAV